MTGEHTTSHSHVISREYQPLLTTNRPRPHMLYGKPLLINDLVPKGTLVATVDSIYGSTTTLDDLCYRLQQGAVGPSEISKMMSDTNTPAKEPKVSTLDKIKAERREKREREELEAKFSIWEEIFASERADVGFFTWTKDDKVYRYATINADEKWYLTGQTTCGMVEEEFIAWLISTGVEPEDFEWVGPVE